MDDLISIQDAVVQGIDRLRKPIWVTPEDHIKIDIRDGCLGPWVHLYAPLNKACSGHDPINMLMLEVNTSLKEFVPYTGPLPDSDEYKSAVSRVTGDDTRGTT